MGAVFGGGPSASDVRREEERARNEERSRLRIAERRLRQNESRANAQGSGIATTASIELGTDEQLADPTQAGGALYKQTGTDPAKQEYAANATAVEDMTQEQRISELVRDAKHGDEANSAFDADALEVNFGGIVSSMSRR